MVELGAHRLEEFEPRGRGVEQIPQFDPRARRQRCRFRFALGAAIDRDAPGLGRAGLARGDGETADGADGGQRLAAEAQGGDIDEIVVGQLRGGMPLHRQHQFGRRHAQAIVGHGDQATAAIAQRHFDTLRPGIDGVFHQLLHRRGRPLDHLAGGDPVDEIGRKNANWHDGRPANLREGGELGSARNPTRQRPLQPAAGPNRPALSGPRTSPPAPARLRSRRQAFPPQRPAASRDRAGA